MAEVAIFDDVELWATAYLRSKLTARPEAYTTGVVVSNAVPTTRPTRLVTVRRDGGPKVNPLTEAARLGVNVWAATEADATNLARLVRAILSGAGVRVRCGGSPKRQAPHQSLTLSRAATSWPNCSSTVRSSPSRRRHHAETHPRVPVHRR